jgi:hypothetical protein
VPKLPLLAVILKTPLPGTNPPPALFGLDGSAGKALLSASVVAPGAFCFPAPVAARLANPDEAEVEANVGPADDPNEVVPTPANVGRTALAQGVDPEVVCPPLLDDEAVGAGVLFDATTPQLAVLDNDALPDLAVELFSLNIFEPP